MNGPDEIANKSFPSAQLTGSPKRKIPKNDTFGQGKQIPTPKAKIELGSEDSPIGESPAFAPRLQQ